MGCFSQTYAFQLYLFFFLIVVCDEDDATIRSDGRFGCPETNATQLDINYNDTSRNTNNYTQMNTNDTHKKPYQRGRLYWNKLFIK